MLPNFDFNDKICTNSELVLLLLFLQNKGFRKLEALVATLILTILVCFTVEIIISKPAIVPLLKGFIPSTQIVFNPSMLFIAIGILGATVMPHNLYLHAHQFAQTWLPDSDKFLLLVPIQEIHFQFDKIVSH